MIKKILKISLLVVFVGAFVATLYYLYSKSKQEPQVFTTQKPIITNIIEKTVATGSVVPRKEIAIKPKLSGIVTKIFVEAGDYVNIGDRIAIVKIIPDMVNLNSAESRLSKAKLSFNDAQIQYDRQLLLFEKGVISDQEFQQIKYAFQTAKEEVRASENNLQLIREGALKDAGNSNTVVESTISGTILDVPVEEGYSVIEANNFNEGTTIASVADMRDMIFKGQIDESEVGKIKTGMPLILTIGAIENTSFGAILQYISPKGVKENGAIQFEIKADVNLKENVFIRAGYSANADIVLRRVDSVMAINESLLQFDQGKVFVEVKIDSVKFEKRFITTGLSDGIQIEVKSGLKMTDAIKVWNKNI
jgi:HlyD family secretion protein